MKFSASRLKRRFYTPLIRYQDRRLVIEDSNKQCEQAGVAPIALKVRESAEPTAPTDVILTKEGGHIIALVNQSWPRGYLAGNRHKLAAFAYWLNQTSASVQRIVVNISDGHKVSVARYKYATSSSDDTLVPDAHFFRDYGYIATDRFAADHAPAWNDRKDDIVWRGALNGVGLFSLDPDTINNPGVLQRLRMAKACEQLDVDFRFVLKRREEYQNLLRRADLIGKRVDTFEWANMKYAIDIDGYTNAWCNFMQRLKLGCCVLKVESQFGFYQWYYHKLVPWEHFVPIRADLSDLQERIDWVKSNQHKARIIAEQGQAFAKAMTFESECNVAVETIEEREARG
ncbi:glycosyl transferase family 90 [Yoonia maricola]|uniref:Glycosyl transferase family 90 n=1 Tax=Yoonia maricola TaxID=420999 RepID=A0A2M8W4J0_9RHOB|nr:glycosyl transferase family 90 [Yoonia maricola]PJI85828.1 glycosyl transferase family 90 [Yoonia maricola]